MDSSSYKFLDIVLSYLTSSKFPRVRCKNTQIISNMFDFLSMKHKFRNYFLEQFKGLSPRHLKLYSLNVSEIGKLKHKVRGAAEYFKIINSKSGIITIFYIGPYSSPIARVD